jgi:small neutral amino acid transporter SnatA (MarC family)
MDEIKRNDLLKRYLLLAVLNLLLAIWIFTQLLKSIRNHDSMSILCAVLGFAFILIWTVVFFIKIFKLVKPSKPNG